MNKTACLIGFLLLISVSLAQITPYTVIVAENGNAVVSADFSEVISEYPTINVPLPLDVEDFELTGAIYVPTSEGIEISSTGEATVSLIYQTALLTTKSDGTWNFELKAPSTLTSVKVILSKDANVQTTNPTAQISQETDSVEVSWDSISADGTVTAQYTISAAAPTPPDEETEGYPLVYIGIAVLVIIILMAFAFFLKKK